jgi:hypothetical protein
MAAKGFMLIILAATPGCHDATRTRPGLVPADAAIDRAMEGPPSVDTPPAYDAATDTAPHPDTCERAYPVCGASSATYACGSAAYPPEMDCLPDATERAGVTTRCCRFTADNTTCALDPDVVCGDDLSYSCGGWDTPAQYDDLICDDLGSTPSGRTGFCCRRYVSDGCQLLTLPGCPGDQYFIRCDPSVYPEQLDRRVYCPWPSTKTDHTWDYCCDAHKPPDL